MPTIRQQRKLEKIITLAQDLLADMQKRSSLNDSAVVRNGRKPKRTRRTAEEAKKMKTEILVALKAKKSAAELAKRYKVSTAYIYMLKTAA
jgi:hypothetical protein